VKISTEKRKLILHTNSIAINVTDDKINNISYTRSCNRKILWSLCSVTILRNLDICCKALIIWVRAISYTACAQLVGRSLLLLLVFLAFLFLPSLLHAVSQTALFLSSSFEPSSIRFCKTIATFSIAPSLPCTLYYCLHFLFGSLSLSSSLSFSISTRPFKSHVFLTIIK